MSSGRTRMTGTADRPDLTGPYAGRTAVFATCHGKERQAQQPFRALLGTDVAGPAELGVALDTDRFGTFAGERPRTLAPRQAALAKARLALASTGLELALASEASYGVLPGIGWPGHEELLTFVDAGRGLEITEVAVSPVVPGRTWRVPGADALPVDELVRCGWPEQAVIVRADGGPVVAKGVTEEPALRTAARTAARRSPTATALVEPDLRAQHNPSRRAVLAELCERMARRLGTPCPDCGCPGWGRVATAPGLPCRWCGTPTDRVAVVTFGCGVCPARQEVPGEDLADPAHCPRCNP